MTGTAGTVLEINGDRAKVRWDSGAIRDPKLFILTPGELPRLKGPCKHENTQTYDIHPSATFCTDCGERLP